MDLKVVQLFEGETHVGSYGFVVMQKDPLDRGSLIGVRQLDEIQ